MYSIRTLVIVSGALSLLPGCSLFEKGPAVQGTGVASHKEIAVANVNNVKAAGIGKLIITQDAAQNETLKIEADENVLPWIEASVANNQLDIKIKDNANIKMSAPIVYRLTVRDMAKIEVYGAVVAEMMDVRTNMLDIVASGSASVKGVIDAQKLNFNGSGVSQCVLSGKAASQNITIQGSGSFDGKELAGKDAVVEASGTVAVTLNVSDMISGSVSGVSAVSYLNEPMIKVATSGVSSVKKA